MNVRTILAHWTGSTLGTVSSSATATTTEKITAKTTARGYLQEADFFASPLATVMFTLTVRLRLFARFRIVFHLLYRYWLLAYASSSPSANEKEICSLVPKHQHFLSSPQDYLGDLDPLYLFSTFVSSTATSQEQ